MLRPYIYLLLILLTLGAAACSGSTPQLIASYPSRTSGGPPPAPQQVQVVYNATLEFEVYNTDAAADQAIDLGCEYGGYLVSSQSWAQDGRKVTTLVLAVPVPNFNNLRRALLGLGSLISERVTGELVSYGPGGWVNYSHITVQLRPKASAWSYTPRMGWNPSYTLEHAVRVFVSLFGFLVNASIWVVFVLGPFPLMGWGAWALLRRGGKK